ncbi:MAG: hypothetical protein P1V81_12345 [Planctomycetota bacterium]|nr:hypothetical protein [Planctomycetota bacterium]
MGHGFVVMSLGLLALVAASLCTGPLIVTVLTAKKDLRLAIAGVHILAGIALHPALTIDDAMPARASEQHQLVSDIQDLDHSWWVRSDMALELSKSLKSQATWHHKIESPLSYWLFPPSVVLIIWGLLALLFYPEGGLSLDGDESS